MCSAERTSEDALKLLASRRATPKSPPADRETARVAYQDLTRVGVIRIAAPN